MDNQRVTDARSAVILARGAGLLRPQTVESLVTAQIDRLRPFERRLLRYSAVLGMTFTEELVESLL